MENITQIWKKIQSPEFNPATDMGLVEQVKQVALTSGKCQGELRYFRLARRNRF